jgi:hypothetical protein
VKPATWANCRRDFVFDGALVDLIVPGTAGLAEWEAFWAALRAGPFGLRAYREGEPILPPETVAWIMAEREAAAPVYVSVAAGTVTANCHFFGGDVRLDIDPREVVSEVAFESVLALMRFVAGAVGRPVLAVPEGGRQEHRFLTVSPTGEA